MNCLAVRDRLAEHVLDVLPGDEASTVEGHLEWCAACRKEARDLRDAAAILAHSVAPVEPPAGLEASVADAVRRVARRGEAPPRRRRGAVAAVLAAALAMSGLSWGAVMAGRSERLREQIAAVEKDRAQSIEQFRDLIDQLEGTDPANIVEVASLLSPRLRSGRGDALVLLSPSGDDLVFVQINGLTSLREEQLPLEVRLVSDRAGELVVGGIAALNSGGAGGAYRFFVEDLQAFDAVLVEDAAGRVLLHGSLGVYDPSA